MIFLALVATTVRAAFRGALSHSDPHTWSLSLACAASVSAILIHSAADFNLYIPANAMVVSWVAAMATGLVSPHVIHMTDSNRDK
jgi:hypothetical protein